VSASSKSLSTQPASNAQGTIVLSGNQNLNLLCTLFLITASSHTIAQSFNATTSVSSHQHGPGQQRRKSKARKQCSPHDRHYCDLLFGSSGERLWT
jgi:hypothetical protein